MKKPFAVIVCCAFAALAVGVFALPAAETPEGKLTIDNPAAVFPVKKLKDGAKAKNPVTFDHKKHGAEQGCKECHHTQPELKAGEKATPCFGGDCHGPAPVTVEGGKVKIDSYAVVHDKKAGKCLKCHGTNEKAKAAKAPTKCSACHGGKEEE